MFRELGLGIVLMLAGDGELARSAGDALLADKVRDAIEEGGFDTVSFEDWHKGYRGGRFWVGFDRVAITRDGARLDAAHALIYPLSVELEFDDGAVVTAGEGRQWHFRHVTVEGDYSLFGRALSVRGVDLVPIGVAGGETAPFCLFRERCAYQVSFGAGDLQEFALDLARRGGAASLRFAWRERDGCVVLQIDGIEVPRGAALSGVGAGLLANRFDGQASLEQGDCAGDGTGSLAPGHPTDAEAVLEAHWSERDGRLDDLLSVLLVALPEAYEYLVE
jgi:hypothetical protein